MRVIRVVLLILGAFVVAVALVWGFQDRLVFTPPTVPTVQGRGATRVDYVASDGQRLFGFLMEGARRRNADTRDSAVGAIIVFHGNGDLADSWVDWAKVAASRTGWPVFLAEYRGYGGLAGRPSFSGVMQDGNAAIDAMSKRFALRADQIVLFGHSLGTGVATRLANERGARALVLEAPMTSLTEMGARTFGPPISWLLPVISRNPFAPLDGVRTLGVPVWVAIGSKDDVIPPEMGRAVFAAAARKGELLEVPTASHGDISDRGAERYWLWFTRAVTPVVAGLR